MPILPLEKFSTQVEKPPARVTDLTDAFSAPQVRAPAKPWRFAVSPYFSRFLPHPSIAERHCADHFATAADRCGAAFLQS
jgi:hypothetical protein